VDQSNISYYMEQLLKPKLPIEMVLQDILKLILRWVSSASEY